ncbi:MAG: TcpQ domain-containing protein [Colwellia sp.]
MNFWLRSIILSFFLAVLAWGFIINQELLLSISASFQNKAEIESTTQEKTVTAPKPKAEIKNKSEPYQQGRKSTNAAALGLSKFYANLYGDRAGNGPKIRNNIVYMSYPPGDLSKILHAREMIVRPYTKNWQSRIESRPFRRGETLNQKLIEYSEKEGIRFIWWLNRDYIIKDPFRVELDILKTSYQVAKSIEGHFQSGLAIFFCYRQRAIVVIEKGTQPFLHKECILLKGKPYVNRVN